MRGDNDLVDEKRTGIPKYNLYIPKYFSQTFKSWLYEGREFIWNSYVEAH